MIISYNYCEYFYLKVEIKTQEQWDELLSKEGLIGKCCFIYLGLVGLHSVALNGILMETKIMLIVSSNWSWMLFH